MSFAVVRFSKEEDSYSEIPTSWILEDNLHCYWPNQKNCGSLIAKRVTPSKDWPLQDIEIEGYYATLEKARRVAENPNYSSNDEGERRRKEKWNKWVNYSETDEDSLGTDDLIDKPPKLFKNKSKNDKVKILSAVTLGRNMEKNNVDSNSKVTEINNVDRSVESSVSGTFESYVVVDGYLEPDVNEEFKDPNINAKDKEVQKETNASTDKLLDSMYKLQLENNFYLKSIYKKLNSNCNSKKSVDDSLSKLLPFQTIDSLMEFENGMTFDMNDSLNEFIHKIGGKNFKDHLHRSLKTVYSNNMAKSCSWLGLRGNFKIKDTKVIHIIKDVMKSVYDNTDNDFEIVTKEWFRLAATRMKVRKEEASQI